MLRAEAVELTCCSGRTWNAEVQIESMDYKPNAHTRYSTIIFLSCDKHYNKY